MERARLGATLGLVLIFPLTFRGVHQPRRGLGRCAITKDSSCVRCVMHCLF